MFRLILRTLVCLWLSISFCTHVVGSLDDGADILGVIGVDTISPDGAARLNLDDSISLNVSGSSLYIPPAVSASGSTVGPSIAWNTVGSSVVGVATNHIYLYQGTSAGLSNLKLGSHLESTTVGIPWNGIDAFSEVLTFDSTHTGSKRCWQGTVSKGTVDHSLAMSNLRVVTCEPEIDVTSNDPGPTTSIADGGVNTIGNEAVGTAKTVTYTVTNSGTDDLTLATATGAAASNAGSVTYGAPGGTIVLPGHTTTFTVTFTPTNNGAFTVPVTFVNNDANETPFNFDITGTGTGGAPEIGVTSDDPGPSTAVTDGAANAIGNEAVGTAKTVTFTVTNSGTADLTLATATGAAPTNAGTVTYAAPGGTTVTPGNTTTFTVTFTPTNNGAFTVPVTFVNNDANETPFNFDITGTGTGGNQAPSANAGPDQMVDHNDLVTLNGTGSTDPDGDTLTYSWVAAAGITLSTTNVASPTFTAPLVATDTAFTFTLTVTDPSGLSHSDTVVITVKDGHSAIISRTQSVVADHLATKGQLILAQDPNLSNRLQRNQRFRAAQNNLSSYVELDAVEKPADVQAKLSYGLNDDSDSMLVSLDTSLNRMKSYVSAASGQGISNSPLDVWVKARWTRDVTNTRETDSSIGYIGVDYQITDKTLVGFIAQTDAFNMEDKTKANSASSQGWMIGPYVATEIGDGLFLNARGAWGLANNEVSPFATYTDKFKSERLLANASLSGTLDGAGILRGTQLSPEIEVSHFEETQKAYTDSNNVLIPETRIKMTNVSAGPTLIVNDSWGDNTKVAFHMGARGVWSNVKSSVTIPSAGFSNLNTDSLRGRVEFGVTWDWNLGGGNSSSLEFESFMDGLGKGDSHTHGVSLKYHIPF